MISFRKDVGQFVTGSHGSLVMPRNGGYDEVGRDWTDGHIGSSSFWVCHIHE